MIVFISVMINVSFTKANEFLETVDFFFFLFRILNFPFFLHFLCSEKDVCRLSSIQLFATPWTINCQAPVSMGFSRQEDWNRLPFPPPEDLPDPGTEPRSPAL